MALRLEWDILDLHTTHAFHIARAAAPPVRRNVCVRVIDDDGVEGWGEAAPSPYYGETAETVSAVLPRYAAVLAHVAEPFALEQIEGALASAVNRNASARAAVSMALHDHAGKRLGVPVWRLWGLSPAAPVSSFTIGIDEPAVMRERVAAASGFPVLKIKVGTEDDERVLRLVRDVAPSARIRVDANTGWTVKQAMRKLPLLEELGIELIEQPLPAEDLDGLRYLRERSRIPIVADESCRTSRDVSRLAGCVDGVNIKLAKCGSMREALRMVHVARAHDLLVMLGCMVESTLAIAGAVQLAPLCDYTDLDGAALLADDPFAGPGIAADGTILFNDSPGLGVERRA
jgi:L-alanine-DL-glutamate epimerase-like enolase superfamily enzyme